MPRILFIICCLLSVICFSGTSYAAQVSPETDKKIQQLQKTIDTDIIWLKTAKGELKDVSEYRIRNKTNLLREELATLINQPDPDLAYLVPQVNKQLVFLDKVGQYLDERVAELKLTLGGDNDAVIMQQIIKREEDRDHYLKAELETINWGKTLNINVGNAEAALTAEVLQRADYFESLVTYTQAQLKNAVATASNAGADITSEQKAKVSILKDRLAMHTASLNIAIEMLETLGQDTTQIKQTLFSVSGDITQDVLNFDVASSLIEEWMTIAKNQALENGAGVTFKVIIFLIILFLTSLVAKLVRKVVRKAVNSSKLNFSMLLQDFFTSISGNVIFALGLLIALSQLGFELAPLLAGFGIAGVIIGFALQDTLSNFASGMMILIYRPYDVGDLINAAGVTGRVSHMSLVSTTVKTLDNQRLIIPNNKIWGDTINNITVEQERRVDMTFGIGYGDDIPKAEKILTDIVMAHPKVKQFPEPTIKLHTLGESSVDFVVRPWADPIDYWDVYWDITREVKMQFDAQGVSIPFPQRDVHIYHEKAAD
ncbi:mechanosensitive ion channel protein [Shewanella sp. UCD-FRSSP16_17]|uniref:mechanosensitive ion channel family protein n=1 Tax=Shewanella sp. UCD-FRSSP16_17 TaxID=1853256 RepID=UPI0007EE9800|nr:mechanosensitive ion channel family protein [Shewanella sp. UCD-FRSSP16_17]OBT06879.1 mechanosensitive ion channel protein [Shewanella sp. UCD-FRSSP16_17]